METAYHLVLYKSKVKTLGLIGHGHIAQKVAKIGHAFSIIIVLKRFLNHGFSRFHLMNY